MNMSCSKKRVNGSYRTTAILNCSHPVAKQIVKLQSEQCYSYSLHLHSLISPPSSVKVSLPSKPPLLKHPAAGLSLAILYITSSHFPRIHSAAKASWSCKRQAFTASASYPQFAQKGSLPCWALPLEQKVIFTAFTPFKPFSTVWNHPKVSEFYTLLDFATELSHTDP